MPFFPRPTKEEGAGRDMRKTVVLLASMALALIVAGGVAFAATIDCTGGSCRGTRAPDTLFGTSRVDRQLGLGGRDLMYGYASADEMYGGGGDDRMRGGTGRDSVSGESGDDALYGNFANDVVNGNRGNDLVVGMQGNDTLSGDPGSDLIRAVDGEKDQINCGGGRRDQVYYDRGLDVLRGCEIRHAR